MTGSNEAKPAPVIDDPISVDVINDPLRWRILGLVSRPKTVRQLAAILERPPSRLYYHLNLLERHGWITRVGTAEAGDRDARVYQGAHVETGFVFGDAIFEQEGYQQDGMKIGHLEAQFRPFEHNLHLLLDAGWPSQAVSSDGAHFRRLSRPRALEFLQRLQSVIDEYFLEVGERPDEPATSTDDDEAQLYGLLFRCEPFTQLPAYFDVAPGHEGSIASRR